MYAYLVKNGGSRSSPLSTKLYHHRNILVPNPTEATWTCQVANEGEEVV